MDRAWFEERMGKEVKRISPKGDVTVIKVTELSIDYLFSYLEKNYKYEDFDSMDDFFAKQEPVKQAVRVHKGPGDSTCVSCEG